MGNISEREVKEAAYSDVNRSLDYGFAGSVITENQDLDLTELTFEFLWGIIWRTLFSGSLLLENYMR